MAPESILLPSSRRRPGSILIFEVVTTPQIKMDSGLRRNDELCFAGTTSFGSREWTSFGSPE
jgi:hypothetical protein